MIHPNDRLELLRNALKERGIDIFIIPSTDPHLGEYAPGHWQIIKWLTGFTGSAGTVVVTSSFAGLWTDSRYYLQAEQQLAGSGFEFVRPGRSHFNDFYDFIFEIAKPGNRIGFDGRIFSVARFRRLQKLLDVKQIKFESVSDPVGDIWTERPQLPFSMAFDHHVRFCGRERSVKINEVREQMSRKNSEYHLLASPDDIMWLLNIRGRDLEFSPVLLSFALVGADQILLFIDENKVAPELAGDFDRSGIVILPYDEAYEVIPSVTDGYSVLLDPGTTSVALYETIAKNSKIIEDRTIPSVLKAVKNKTEIENIGKIMVKDGVALTRFFYWFYFNAGRLVMTENSLSARLLEFRSEQPDFLGQSFPAIVAFNENSALPHYTPETQNGSVIGERGILLLDSGGQYSGGTTDITRTVHVGIPSAGQKRDFTLVLKGHISLALAKFPAGTRGSQLDFAARKALWEAGLNYAHGTGHGVGFCLNVHEGPQSISQAENRTAIEPGMLTSNEPALYRERDYGIRTENLILCYEDEETEFGKFLRFDTVSLCYIDKALIDKSLLDNNEIDWLNSYHSGVFEQLGPYLSPEEKLWLKEKTDPL